MRKRVHLSRWLRFLRNTIVQPDFFLGVIAGLSMGIWAYHIHSKELVNDEATILAASIGASVGLLAVTLAAMTLILGFLQGFYKTLIRSVAKKEMGGLRQFFYPFELISVISGGAALCALGGLLDGASSSKRVASILFGLSLGLVTWAVVGAIQLVFIFVGHGERWLELDEALAPEIPDIDIPNDPDVGEGIYVDSGEGSTEDGSIGTSGLHASPED